MGITNPEHLSQEEKDVFWMQYALNLARKAEQEGEVPVGAVIVDGDKLIAEGWNQTIQRSDPTAHAEIVALRQAGQSKQNYRLINLTMYVTLEPCPMCAGALVHSRLKRLVTGADDYRTGAAGSLMNIICHESLNHKLEHTNAVLRQESSQLISQFFKNKRKCG